MQRLDLEVQPRNLGKIDDKRNVNQLRRDGWVPAVVYGHGEPIAIAIDEKILGKAIQTKAGINAIFNIKLGSQIDMSVIKEVQRDVFTRKPIHVDFQRIDAKETIEVTIPVHIFGEANGVKNQGGILDHIQRDVRIKCLPDDLIPSIDVVENFKFAHIISISKWCLTSEHFKQNATKTPPINWKTMATLSTLSNFWSNIHSSSTTIVQSILF